MSNPAALSELLNWLDVSFWALVGATVFGAVCGWAACRFIRDRQKETTP